MSFIYRTIFVSLLLCNVDRTNSREEERSLNAMKVCKIFWHWLCKLLTEGFSFSLIVQVPAANNNFNIVNTTALIS